MGKCSFDYPFEIKISLLLDYYYYHIIDIHINRSIIRLQLSIFDHLGHLKIQKRHRLKPCTHNLQSDTSSPLYSTLTLMELKHQQYVGFRDLIG